MADLSLVTDKYFTIASETFTDNLSSSIAAGAVTVPVLNATEYTNGDDCVITVDPGTNNEATFIGRKNGVQFENCVWTEGNLSVGHSNGATVIDYDSATHHNAQSKGILQFATSAGALRTQPVRDALGLGATAANGWEVSPYTYTMGSGQTKGQREFDLTVANNDLSSIYSPGERLRFTRGTVAATQCADFTAASTQYADRASASMTGLMSTVTDDITAEAHIKPTLYTTMAIAARLDAVPNNGWQCYVSSTGQIVMQGFNAGGANTRSMSSYTSVNLNEWQHVAATLDMSGWTTATNAIYINGLSVPVLLSSTGTNPTSFVNTGNFAIGRSGSLAGNYFNGRISDVRVWNAIRTQTQIRDNMYQALTGSETNLIGYWKLANSLVDSTPSANNLTASGGLTTTTVDNPFQPIEYAIIVKVVYSAPNTTVTVITPSSGSIPNQTLTAPYYSAQRSPYGFPSDRTRWQVMLIASANLVSAALSTSVWSLMNSVLALTIPTGAWKWGYKGFMQQSAGGSASSQCHVCMATSLPVASSHVAKSEASSYDSGAQFQGASVYGDDSSYVSTPTVYSLYTTYTQGTATVTNSMRGDLATTTMWAESAYV